MKKLLFLLFNLVFSYMLVAQVAEEIDSLNALLRESEKNEKTELLIQLAEAYQRYDQDSSLKLFDEAIKQARHYNQTKKLADACYGKAIVLNRRGDYEQAADLLQKSLQLSTQMANSDLIISCHYRLGTVYYNHGNREKSIEHYFKGLEIIEGIHEDSLTKKQQQLHVYISNDIGTYYYRIRQDGYTLKYWKKASELAGKYNLHQYIPQIVNNIGMYYQETDNYDSAKYYYTLALETGRKNNNSRIISLSLKSLGAMYLEQGAYNKALDNFLKALKLFKEMNNQEFIINTNYNIANSYIKLDAYDSAYPYIVEGLDIAMAMNRKDKIGQGNFIMSLYYAGKQEYKKAYEIHTYLSELKDTIFNEDIAAATAEMQTKYETAQKEKEIAEQTLLIEQQQSDIRRQWMVIGGIIALILIMALLFVILFNRYRSKQKQKQTELEKRSIETEQRLLRSQMNPHFIFNSLSSVQNYISIDDKIAAMSFLSKFAELIRNILMNSREATIPLQDEIDTLRLYMELEQLRLKNKFDFKIEVDERLDAEAVYIPPMLIQPFVENAIKHGLRNKEDKGTLEISFRKNAQVIYCKVKDDGIGREKARQLQEADHRSLALQIIRERLDVLKNVYNAELELSIEDLRTEQGNPAGTQVKISLPFEEE